MTLTLALAATATLVALAFSASTYERWLTRRRRHELAWSLSLLFFACGSLALWAGAALGWDGTSFRLFYLFGAVLNVPFLALGTVYLLAGQERGDRIGAAVALGGAFAAGVVLVAPLRGTIDPGLLPQGSDVFGPLPRILAAVASAAGASVVFVGAAWSAARLARRRRSDAPGTPVPPARLAIGNLLIAAGTATLSASGLLNSVLGEMQAFAVTLTVGITILFVGFLVASAPHRPPLAGVGPVVTKVPATGLSHIDGRATG
ncbi:MAG: hypothetical protein ACR2G7_05295 [Acidimicrobiales bacterium]